MEVPKDVDAVAATLFVTGDSAQEDQSYVLEQLEELESKKLLTKHQADAVREAEPIDALKKLHRVLLAELFIVEGDQEVEDKFEDKFAVKRAEDLAKSLNVELTGDDDLETGLHKEIE